jgi:MOSC domain-containing protein YiiM
MALGSEVRAAPEVGVVTGVNISARRGIQKRAVAEATLVTGLGIQGDAHAGDWHRQVSLLAEESVDKMRRLGLDVGPGAFAENLTTRGLAVPTLRIGDLVVLGEVRLEVTQIGKECHSHCAIYQQAGDCVMPREGVFARVLAGGQVRAGMAVQILRRDRALADEARDRGAVPGP